jgi:hypothetical protein
MTGLAQDTTVPVFGCILRQLHLWYYVVGFKPVLTVTPLAEWSLRLVASRPSFYSRILAILNITVTA